MVARFVDPSLFIDSLEGLLSEADPAVSVNELPGAAKMLSILQRHPPDAVLFRLFNDLGNSHGTDARLARLISDVDSVGNVHAFEWDNVTLPDAVGLLDYYDDVHNAFTGVLVNVVGRLEEVAITEGIGESEAEVIKDFVSAVIWHHRQEASDIVRGIVQGAANSAENVTG